MLEPQENGLVDLPDYEHTEDETFPPFPPPASPEREDGEGAEPEEESGRGASVPVPPKRTVKRNIPKLNAERLVSERGLPALRHVFEKAKFKGSKTLLHPVVSKNLLENMACDSTLYLTPICTCADTQHLYGPQTH
ncbi:hypothetical protein AB1E18_003182 [Capra hircus]